MALSLRRQAARWTLAALLAGVTPGLFAADADPRSTPKPFPGSRPEMKQALESLKRREPRLPLPPPTDAERQAAGTVRPIVHNGRARALYLPKEWYSADFRNDPTFTLDNTFKVRLFWVVSRANNCHYCLGHQEVKLSTAGQTDDQIAALDSDWGLFDADQRAALELARRLTLEPHRLSADDVAKLQRQFGDGPLVEMTHTIAMFNSVNRWTDSLGLPQDERFRDHLIDLTTATSERYQNAKSIVVPSVVEARGALESRAEVEAQWARAKQRTPIVTLVSDEAARRCLPEGVEGPAPNWLRALARFPETAKLQAAALHGVETTGQTPPLLRAQIAWCAARQDRAWYAARHARARLLRLGQSDDQIYALDGDLQSQPEATRVALEFARKLTTSSASMTDADIAGLRKSFTDAQTAQIVYTVCAANYFDRFTETLQLPLDE